MTGIDYQALFDALPSPYMVLDNELRYVAANKAYLAATMKTLDDLAGKYVFDVFPDNGESGRRIEASFRQVLASGQPDTLAFLPYAIPIAEAEGGGFASRHWTVTNIPLIGPDGATDFILQSTIDVTNISLAEDGASSPFTQMPEAAALVTRAQESDALKDRMANEAKEVRRLFQQAPSMIGVLLGSEHKFVFANDALSNFLGLRQLLGTNVRDSLPDIASQDFADWLDQVYKSGEAKSGKGLPVRIERPGEGEADRYVDFAFHPIFAEDGQVRGVFVQGTDRTTEVEAQKRQAILLDELNHRVKNILATVQSIARQTLKDSESPSVARATFEARILALSHAHDLLSRSSWAGADLRTIMTRELSPYGMARSTMDGAPIRLPPRAAVSLGMVAHELATNSAKYGAFSNGQGRVFVSWGLVRGQGGSTLDLSWREQGGPPVKTPSRLGFGSRLIMMSLEGELGGTADLRFDPDGLRCEVSIPYEESTPHGRD